MFPMAYSPDLRKRILDFVEVSGKKSETFRLFNIIRSTIDKWLASENLLEIKQT